MLLGPAWSGTPNTLVCFKPGSYGGSHEIGFTAEIVTFRLKLQTNGSMKTGGKRDPGGRCSIP